MVDEWVDKAACKGFPTKWWFPERGQRSGLPLFICAHCPVATECLEYALDLFIEQGVWGGLTEKQRRSEKRRRRTERRAGEAPRERSLARPGAADC